MGATHSHLPTTPQTRVSGFYLANGKTFWALFHGDEKIGDFTGLPEEYEEDQEYLFFESKEAEWKAFCASFGTTEIPKLLHSDPEIATLMLLALLQSTDNSTDRQEIEEAAIAFFQHEGELCGGLMPCDKNGAFTVPLPPGPAQTIYLGRDNAGFTVVEVVEVVASEPTPRSAPRA